MSRVLAGGTALMFLIGGGAIEASTTHGAVAASVSTKVSSGTPPPEAGVGAGARQAQAPPAQEAPPQASKHRKKHAQGGGSIYAGTTRSAPGSVNTVSSRAAVNAAYWRSYAPGLNVPTGYNGDESRCVAGSHHLRLADRHPQRDQLRALAERPGAGQLQLRAERPLAAHRADDVGQNRLSHAPSARGAATPARVPPTRAARTWRWPTRRSPRPGSWACTCRTRAAATTASVTVAGC